MAWSIVSQFDLKIATNSCLISPYFHTIKHYSWTKHLEHIIENMLHYKILLHKITPVMIWMKREMMTILAVVFPCRQQGSENYDDCKPVTSHLTSYVTVFSLRRDGKLRRFFKSIII